MLKISSIMLYININSSLICLRHLLVSRNIIEFTILTEMCSCLLEVEKYIGTDTLFSDIEHPIVVADTGIIAGFTATGDTFYVRGVL